MQHPFTDTSFVFGFFLGGVLFYLSEPWKQCIHKSKLDFDASVDFFFSMQMGYRHFDTAKIYGSEPALGNALTESILEGTVKREDVFVTSKLWGSDHDDPVSALNQTLK